MKIMLILGFALLGLLGVFTACNHSPKVVNNDPNAVYACPMHPEVTGKAGDKCSKCGMDLEATAAVSTVSADANAAYACPMHPEVTGKMGDKCPKCGMALEPAKANAANRYKMAFSSSPATLEAGKSAMLSLKPEMVGQANTPVPLDLHHEKKIHLIVVYKDLSYFEHIHPDYQADGSYQIKVLDKGAKFTNGRGHNETLFERGGDYVLFADYMPTGASGQLERIPLTVSGTPYQPVTFAKEKLSSTVDGYTVTLASHGGKFVTNNQMHIEGTIMQGGKVVPAESLENYLGAKAHVVVIHADAEHYLHVHPDVEDNKLDLHATFEETGIYRCWLQFQTGGKVHTADFVFNVTEGKAGEVKHEGHEGSGHDHKEGDGHHH
ncbi:MAG: heavy metal-binding domain-containing protein [Saprospiraceae bacterium]